MQNLSYLMGAEEISDKELGDLDIEISGKAESGHRMLKIPDEKVLRYIEVIKMKMTPGFWNEIVGEREIIFIFKFKDGKIKEYKLSPANEQEISDLCESFNDEPPRKAANVYKYISENKFITILCLNTTRV
ncbi:hypothetical protein A3H65_00810 [Candidatus Giovannonibacteria bacterium RIFCSPLOWO2_02_FULL_45_14]|nr:MAG: hypothetical protein A3C75_02080 [Candidatus Giovannonibacteria bacterium RIFCSPHIGHO2_02_FULL_44_31]OGF77101.1 MAG: hypothetical protein A3E62_01580 [Candidatus Giovannonibacteria bacterium RIFCSPHIGHO2_12_FULL_44_29]OGF91312.1 MAG: hypothetical protein A3H65_00810 [Candidatus Giovannonibacteria bacterium RIFCSPLOWO2_02_FULL_45_14]